MSNEPNRIETAGTYQMLWDCKYCGTKKLLGLTHRFCPNCGAAQDPDARYFPADDEKVAVEDHVYVGADLMCGSCGTANSAKSQFCQQCGAPLENAARAGTTADEIRKESEQFEASGSRDIEMERFQSRWRGSASPSQPARR